jgi:hypothetical protein
MGRARARMARGAAMRSQERRRRSRSSADWKRLRSVAREAGLTRRRARPTTAERMMRIKRLLLRRARSIGAPTMAESQLVLWGNGGVVGGGASAGAVPVSAPAWTPKKERVGGVSASARAAPARRMAMKVTRERRVVRPGAGAGPARVVIRRQMTSG